MLIPRNYYTLLLIFSSLFVFHYGLNQSSGFWIRLIAWLDKCDKSSWFIYSKNQKTADVKTLNM